jgi:hypothetical protein
VSALPPETPTVTIRHFCIAAQGGVALLPATTAAASSTSPPPPPAESAPGAPPRVHHPATVASWHRQADQVLGCSHYARKCQLVAGCCQKLVPCRLCHDEATTHMLDRTATTHMVCGLPLPPDHTAMRKLRIVTLGFRVGDRSRGRYATPADFAIHDGTPYRGLRVRRWGLGFVHRSRTILCRAVPNPNWRYDSQLLHRCMQGDPCSVSCDDSLCRVMSHEADVQRSKSCES